MLIFNMQLFDRAPVQQIAQDGVKFNESQAQKLWTVKYFFQISDSKYVLAHSKSIIEKLQTFTILDPT